MKKFIAILLLAILGLSIFGLFPVFKILQFHAQLEMQWHIKNGVHPSEIHEITFHKNEEPQWVKRDKEFTHQGNLYDIVEMKSEGETRIYSCLKDTHEARIKRQINKINLLALHRSKNAKYNKNKVNTLFKFQYFSKDHPKNTLPSIINQGQWYFQNNYISLCFPPPLPPPEPVS